MEIIGLRAFFYAQIQDKAKPFLYIGGKDYWQPLKIAKITTTL